MRNLQRHFLRKYGQEEIEGLLKGAVAGIVEKVDGLVKVIAFGSALSDRFDDCSDLDLVLVFETPEQAGYAEKKLYQEARHFSRPIDFLCVDRETFLYKSEIGGVYFIAAREGRVLWECAHPT